MIQLLTDTIDSLGERFFVRPDVRDSDVEITQTIKHLENGCDYRTTLAILVLCDEPKTLKNFVRVAEQVGVDIFPCSALEDAKKILHANTRIRAALVDYNLHGGKLGVDITPFCPARVELYLLTACGGLPKKASPRFTVYKKPFDFSMFLQTLLNRNGEVGGGIFT